MRALNGWPKSSVGALLSPPSWVGALTEPQAVGEDRAPQQKELALQKRLIIVGLSAAAVLVPASPASAFYCANASKAEGAGVVDESQFRINNGGNAVAPGAFYVSDDGTELMLRGGEFHGPDAETGFKSFGAAKDQAIVNGPADRGIVEPD